MRVVLARWPPTSQRPAGRVRQTGYGGDEEGGLYVGVGRLYEGWPIDGLCSARTRGGAGLMMLRVATRGALSMVVAGELKE